MKKNKILALLCCLAMLVGMLVGCSGSNDNNKGGDENYKIALITMDSIDQHWVTLNEGAQKAAVDALIKSSYYRDEREVQHENT